MKSPRRAAVSILRAWSKGHVYADGLIERHASRNSLSSADRALLTAIGRARAAASDAAASDAAVSDAAASGAAS